MATRAQQLGINLPQPIWLILLALAIGLGAGLNGGDVVKAAAASGG